MSDSVVLGANRTGRVADGGGQLSWMDFPEPGGAVGGTSLPLLSFEEVAIYGKELKANLVTITTAAFRSTLSSVKSNKKKKSRGGS